MKNRYLVFEGDFYYPSGGAEDFVAAFDDKEEAINRAKSTNENWVNVFDTQELKTIYEE